LPYKSLEKRFWWFNHRICIEELRTIVRALDQGTWFPGRIFNKEPIKQES